MKEIGCICEINGKIADWADGFCFTCNKKLSKKDLRELGNDLREERILQIKTLQTKRNKLNREIATLKKANLSN